MRLIMNVNIQTVHFDADQKLIQYVNQKIEKLPQFHDRIINVDVFLKLANVVHKTQDLPTGRSFLLMLSEIWKCGTSGFEYQVNILEDVLLSSYCAALKR